MTVWGTYATSFSLALGRRFWWIRALFPAESRPRHLHQSLPVFASGPRCSRKRKPSPIMLHSASLPQHKDPCFESLTEDNESGWGGLSRLDESPAWCIPLCKRWTVPFTVSDVLSPVRVISHGHLCSLGHLLSPAVSLLYQHCNQEGEGGKPQPRQWEHKNMNK